MSHIAHFRARVKRERKLIPEWTAAAKQEISRAADSAASMATLDRTANDAMAYAAWAAAAKPFDETATGNAAAMRDLLEKIRHEYGWGRIGCRTCVSSAVWTTTSTFVDDEDEKKQGGDAPCRN